MVKQKHNNEHVPLGEKKNHCVHNHHQSNDRSDTSPADEINSCLCQDHGVVLLGKARIQNSGKLRIRISNIEVEAANHWGPTPCGFTERKRDRRLRGPQRGPGLRPAPLRTGLPAAGPHPAGRRGLPLPPQPEGAARASAVTGRRAAAAAAGWQRTAGPSAGEGRARALCADSRGDTAQRSRPAENGPFR